MLDCMFVGMQQVINFQLPTLLRVKLHCLVIIAYFFLFAIIQKSSFSPIKSVRFILLSDMYGAVDGGDVGKKNNKYLFFPLPSLYNQIIVAPGTPILPSAAYREDRRLLSHLIDTRDTDCFSSGGYEFHLHHQTTIPVEARLMLLHINLFLYTSQTMGICTSLHGHNSYMQNHIDTAHD